MLAKELATEEIPFLSLSDTIEKASVWMDEFKVEHLPVVDQGKLAGTLSEETIMDIEDWAHQVRQHEMALAQVSCRVGQHVFECIRLLTETRLTVLPVVTKEMAFVGSVSRSMVIDYLGQLSSIKHPGGIIELELNASDFAMSEIVQIIESDNARMLGCLVAEKPNSKSMYVTLKLNKNNLSSVIQTFERYQYKVSATYFEEEHPDMVQERYDNLMRYLNT